ncbi:hypothetical protein SAMN02746095_02256 [Acidocella aminolytica 101 = DSM 11237]|nr:hypothetical protein SAMN02746095_02256 [Acidocella aminolytica 101 = DSM 11237]
MIAVPDLVVVCVIFKAQTISSRRGPMFFIDIDFPVLWERACLHWTMPPSNTLAEI